MRYVYLRLFLSEVEQPPILVETGDIDRRLSRQDYLTEVFNRRWKFVHRGADLIYVPIRREEGDDETFTFGRLGKQFRALENSGPDEKFEATQHVGWRASNLILNTSSESDGQKLAMQDRGEVGKPLAIVSSLVYHINEHMVDSGWTISVNAIVEKRSFWEAVEKYQGEITRAEFTYVTPNVLGIRSKLNERLKEYREAENAQEVTVTLKEPKGNLKFDSQEVRDAVEYTSEGGGSAKLKAGNDTVFDSRDDEKAKDVQTDDSSSFDNAEGRTRLIEQFFHR